MVEDEVTWDTDVGYRPSNKVGPLNFQKRMQLNM